LAREGETSNALFDTLAKWNNHLKHSDLKGYDEPTHEDVGSSAPFECSRPPCGIRKKGISKPISVRFTDEERAVLSARQAI